ncbi:hypothetical protein Ae201684P_016568 [Aphanomyces euteiches]|nr:hypothetical protein Ae201684P_016568 [Aphanomyces euteiches]
MLSPALDARVAKQGLPFCRLWTTTSNVSTEFLQPCVCYLLTALSNLLCLRHLPSNNAILTSMLVSLLQEFRLPTAGERSWVIFSLLSLHLTMKTIIAFGLLAMAFASSSTQDEAKENEHLLVRPIYRFPTIVYVPTVIERPIFRPVGGVVVVDRRRFWEDSNTEADEEAKKKSGKHE